MNGRPPKPLPTQNPAIPPCPSQLKGEARKEWRRVTRELLAAGVLMRCDMATLSLYCVAWARWKHAEAEVAKLGEVVKTKSGNVIQNPWLGVANTAAKQCHRFAVEFGLTPSSRRKVEKMEAEEAGLDMPT